MKRVFRYKKDDTYDGDEPFIWAIEKYMLKGWGVKENTKITIILERF